MRTRRALLTLLLATLLACSGNGLATAPDPAPAPATPADPPASPTPDPDSTDGSGGALRIAISEPAAIVPFDAVDDDELLVVDALFDSLTRHEATTVVTPAAASSWSPEAGGAAWTFRLREDARFHDGTPVTAEDFVFAWETAVRHGAAGFHLRDVVGYEQLRSGASGRLRGVEAVDAHTLRVELYEPRAEFPLVVAHPSLAPVPGERYRADPEAFRRSPVGNGPFAAAEALVPGQYIRLQQSPEWRNAEQPPHVDEVLFRFMDPETAFVAFQQGRLQVSPLPEGALERAVEQYGASPDGYRGPGVINGTTPAVYFLAFDVTAPPFDDVAVRRAVSLAIDRDAIVESIQPMPVEAADALVPTYLGGRAGSCDACRHDPEEARALLEDRDEPIESITLWFNRDGGHRAIAEQVRQDLADVGIGPVVFRSPSFADYLDVLDAGEAGFFRFGWRPEYPTPDELLYPLFHSSEIAQSNHMRYRRDDVDALLDEARANIGVARRRFLYQQVEDRVINRDQVIIPLLRYRHHHVVSDEVIGFRLDPLGYANLHAVRLVE